MRPQCTTPDCSKPAISHYLCSTHYRWALRHGLTAGLPHQPKPNTAKRYTPAQRDAAFWSRCDPARTDNCIIWLGGHSTDGYGIFMHEGGSLAHHYLAGKPTAGMVWDHVVAWGCTHRDCVWPGHLEEVTPQENNRRGGNGMRDRTHCPWGHEYTEVNIYRGSRGERVCLACRQLWKKQPRRLPVLVLGE